MSLNETLTSYESLFSGSNLARASSQCYPNLRSFVGKSHSVDNTVKASLTFCAPIMRHTENSTSITLSTANTVPTPTNTETDTHRNVRLAFGDMQENAKLKLSNNI